MPTSLPLPLAFRAGAAGYGLDAIKRNAMRESVLLPVPDETVTPVMLAVLPNETDCLFAANELLEIIC